MGEEEREEQFTLKTKHVQKPWAGQGCVIQRKTSRVFSQRVKREWKGGARGGVGGPTSGRLGSHVKDSQHNPGKNRKPATKRWIAKQNRIFYLHTRNRYMETENKQRGSSGGDKLGAWD